MKAVINTKKNFHNLLKLHPQTMISCWMSVQPMTLSTFTQTDNDLILAWTIDRDIYHQKLLNTMNKLIYLPKIWPKSLHNNGKQKLQYSIFCCLIVWLLFRCSVVFIIIFGNSQCNCSQQKLAVNYVFVNLKMINSIRFCEIIFTKTTGLFFWPTLTVM